MFASFVAYFFVTSLLARNPVDYPRVLPSVLGKDKYSTEKLVVKTEYSENLLKYT